MNLEENISMSLDRLIKEGQRLRRGNYKHNRVISTTHKEECSGWIASTINIIELITSGLSKAYIDRSKKIAEKDYGYIINQQVGELTSLLENLKCDIQDGLLISIVDRVRAETFDNFLDHAQSYYNEDKKKESGVIAGVVFEDTIRRMCTRNNISETGNKLDSLINELAKVNIITPIKAKRARVAAHVRTKATHAQWDGFELNDVEETIKVTRDFIENHLE